MNLEETSFPVSINIRIQPSYELRFSAIVKRANQYKPRLRVNVMPTSVLVRLRKNLCDVTARPPWTPLMRQKLTKTGAVETYLEFYKLQ